MPKTIYFLILHRVVLWCFRCTSDAVLLRETPLKSQIALISLARKQKEGGGNTSHTPAALLKAMPISVSMHCTAWKALPRADAPTCACPAMGSGSQGDKPPPRHRFMHLSAGQGRDSAQVLYKALLSSYQICRDQVKLSDFVTGFTALHKAPEILLLSSVTMEKKHLSAYITINSFKYSQNKLPESCCYGFPEGEGVWNHRGAPRRCLQRHQPRGRTGPHGAPCCCWGRCSALTFGPDLPSIHRNPDQDARDARFILRDKLEKTKENRYSP